jgi:adenosylcobinamide kinase/adenosylcobinamide-phosphate guanylyltransferase
MPRATLVLGGARSGKSAHALRLAEASGRAPVYLATATAGDAEMAERIRRHKARRGNRWTTIEEPLALVDGLAAACGEDRVVVVDCLTLWLSNLIDAGRDADTEGDRLALALDDLPGPAILVSNEVGLGIVPDNALARGFRDAAGRLNQKVAAAAARVVFVAAGLAMTLKGGAETS